MDDKTKMQFAAVRDWVQAKLATQQEPPWSWFRLMKLRECLDDVLKAEESKVPVLVAKDGEEVLPDMIEVNLP